jgi:hypothetical protein
VELLGCCNGPSMTVVLEVVDDVVLVVGDAVVDDGEAGQGGRLAAAVVVVGEDRADGGLCVCTAVLVVQVHPCSTGVLMMLSNSVLDMLGVVLERELVVVEVSHHEVCIHL